MAAPVKWLLRARAEALGAPSACVHTLARRRGAMLRRVLAKKDELLEQVSVSPLEDRAPRRRRTFFLAP